MVYSQGGKMGDDVALLHQVRDANPAAGDQFLEYLVLQKRSTVRETMVLWLEILI
jgi:hypothetical protein